MPKTSTAVCAALFVSCAAAAQAQALDEGRSTYMSLCVNCHGGDANGGERGPSITRRITQLDDAELSDVILNGKSGGMPSFPLTDTETRSLVNFLRTQRDARFQRPPVTTSVELVDNSMLEGEVLNRSLDDLQLRTGDGRIVLLRSEGDVYRKVTSNVDWPTYHGDVSGNRYSGIGQINVDNVGELAPAWVFAQRGAGNLQGTPVVVDGIMYVTNSNECTALDAGTGRQLWNYSRPRTRGLIGNAAGGLNRGVALAGDRVFMVTDHAHLIALDRFSGDLLWDTVMADWRQNYNATSAPLVVGDLVISGTAGGEQGVRGFVAAYDQSTGKEVWRTWTVPAPGEPGSETWGEGIHHPSAATWMTGTYDADLGLIYWPTGNPGPDFNGDGRPGDNLYSDSILALDEKTGEMKWYFQFTPHDVWDWDAAEPPVLIDAEWKGAERKLLLQANRNGFFYVFDRTNGELLLWKQFVDKLTWADGLDEKGRPIVNPDVIPTEQGTLVCPSIEGGSNWFSTSYNPDTGLYYVQTTERCSIFTKRAMDWAAGRGYNGGAARTVNDNDPKKVLRAIDIETGEARWEIPQIGPANSWGGVLSTAGGIVIFAEDSGALMAVDAEEGERLWSFQTNSLWKASPMTYMFDGKQYIAIAAGPNILAFALPD